HPPVAEAAAYPSPADFEADLDTIDRSLTENGSAALARGRLRALRRAADVFGFHLASLDLRQNADVHERVMAELIDAAGLGVDYRALDEAGRVELLAHELGNMRPLSSPHLSYGEETTAELAMLAVAADAHRRYGRLAMPHYVISKADSVSDILEVAGVLKEGGLLPPRPARLAGDNPPPFAAIAPPPHCA